MISMIVAHDMNRGIGSNNSLLCHLPNDLMYFKSKTVGKRCVFGRKTIESIGKLLPDRNTLIMSLNNVVLIGDKLYVTVSMDYILEYNKLFPEQEIMICGGGSLYEQFLPYASRLYITEIHHTFDNADSYFPMIDFREWERVSKTKGIVDDKNIYPHDFIVLERIKNN